MVIVLTWKIVSWQRMYPPENGHISHLRKIVLPATFKGDMLVCWSTARIATDPYGDGLFDFSWSIFK